MSTVPRPQDLQSCYVQSAIGPIYLLARYNPRRSVADGGEFIARSVHLADHDRALGIPTSSAADSVITYADLCDGFARGHLMLLPRTFRPLHA